ncbi:MAG: hypothetical protein GF334_11845 [Candidatus Altiarchaeales archaeon]|nr:hypothetical protein [Candidatus Altiarchaeales archaeon]
MKYEVHVTEEQLSLLTKALELWGRLCMGQIEEAALPEIFVDRLDDFAQTKEELRRLVSLMTGMDSPTASHGIRSDKVHPSGRVAWDMYKAFLHRLSWDRNPEGGVANCFDRPFPISDRPLPTIKKASDDEQSEELPERRRASY